MKVVCIKPTNDIKSEFTVGKIYPVIRTVEDGGINIYTGELSRMYILQNDNNVMCAWSYGPGNGTTQIYLKEHFSELRNVNLQILGI